MAERGGNRARREVTDLMARAAAVGLNEIEPLLLRVEVFRNAVAGTTRTREFVPTRNL